MNILYLRLLPWDIVQVHLVHVLRAVLAVWIERVVTVADVVLRGVPRLLQVLLDGNHLFLRATLRVSTNGHLIVAPHCVLDVLSG